MLKQLINVTKLNGGATYSPSKKKYMSSGYAVATEGNEVVVPLASFNAVTVALYWLRHRRQLRGDNCLGTWVNDGKVYLDISEVKADRLEAIRLGYERRQLAIFDLGTFEEINLGGAQ